MAAEEPPQEGFRQVPVVWVGVDDLPVHFANQFVGVVAPGEAFLTLGTIVPPPILGNTIEERKAAAEAIQFVQVKPIARIGLTPDRLRELIKVLQTTLSNYEKQPRMKA